jgi:molybdopterin synthase sulfur carrier subunit
VATIKVRYFAGAQAAAGTPDEQLELTGELTGKRSVGDVIAELGTRRGVALQRVLAASSFLVDGVAVRDRDAAIKDGAQLDVLPPFAGG